jgi:hypothetical protein
MKDKGKPDITDFLWHVLPDPDPTALMPFHAIDPAMVLLVEAVRQEGMKPNAMRIMSVFR